VLSAFIPSRDGEIMAVGWDGNSDGKNEKNWERGRNGNNIIYHVIPE